MSRAVPQHEQLPPPSTVALVDIHQTLILSNNQPNERLLQTFLRTGITDLYLVTNRSLEAEIKSQRTIAGYWSFLRLTRYLKQCGFEVHGIITRADPAFNEGLGAVYKQVIEPYSKLEEQQKPFPPKYSVDCTRNHQQREMAKRDAKNAGFGDVKGWLMSYFLRTKPAHVTSCIYVDDDEACLQSARMAVLRADLPIKMSYLQTSAQDYLQPVMHHLYGDEVKKAIKKLEEGILGKRNEPLKRWTTGLFGYGRGEEVKIFITTNGERHEQGSAYVTFTMKKLLAKMESAIARIRAHEQMKATPEHMRVLYQEIITELQQDLQKAHEENNSWYSFFTRDRAAMSFYTDWNEKLTALLPPQNQLQRSSHV